MVVATLYVTEDSFLQVVSIIRAGINAAKPDERIQVALEDWCAGIEFYIFQKDGISGAF